MLRMTQMLCHREVFALYIRIQCSLLSHLAPNSFVENLMLSQSNVSLTSRCVPAKDFSRQFQVSAILRSLNQFKRKPSSKKVYLLHYVIYNKPRLLKLELDYMIGLDWIVTRIVKGNCSYLELSGFGQKDQKHLIKDLEVLCLYMFYCTISSSVRAEKRQNKTKA